MKKLEIIIEPTDDGLWASIPALPGCISFGKDFNELKKNIDAAIKLHLEGMEEDREEIPDFKDYLFKMDISFFFKKYPVSISGIAEYSKINRSLLSQYANGLKIPSINQVKKIQDAIKKIGEEMSYVSFI